MDKSLSLEQIDRCGLTNSEAATLLPLINQCLADLPAVDCWQQLTQTILKPNHPFALHQLVYNATFSDWDVNQGPPPVWIPTAEQIRATHIAAVMDELKLTTYSDLHDWSVQHRAEFWDFMIRRLGICFQQQYSKLVDLSAGIEHPTWLLDARFNIIDSCFQADADAPAIAFQPEEGTLAYWTYRELLNLTNRVANGFVDAGFQTGEAIAIAMPMTAESIAIYLGIVKAGGVVVSIADSFAADEIATRLQISNAKAIVTQDVILRSGKQLPLYSKVVAAGAPPAIVLTAGAAPIQLRAGDRLWADFLSSNTQFNAVSVDASADTNILFSSGTTGEPKAIPWTQTTPIKCAADGHLHQDIHSGDVVAWPTNLGWMMGPWLIYASLINQATIALYYGTPCDRGFGEFVQDAHVTMLGVVPSLVSTWKTTHCMEGLDWSTVKAFSSTGECSNPQDMLFLMSLAGYKPVVEYCGGTEIGGAYITGTLVQPASPATFTTPALGLEIAILNEDGYPAKAGETFIIPPSIGLSTKLINRDHDEVYFAHTPGSLRRHGDRLERLPNGYYRAQGRVDDTMNLSGIKVSSAQIEQILNTVDGVSETAAIAISPAEGGPSQLVIYTVVTSGNYQTKETLKSSFQAIIKQRLNPLFKLHDVVIIKSLPRTASNKVMRRILRDRYSLLITRASTTHYRLPI